MALRQPASSVNVTKPKPRLRPVSRSLTTFASTIEPHASNAALRPSLVVAHASPPTNTFFFVNSRRPDRRLDPGSSPTVVAGVGRQQFRPAGARVREGVAVRQVRLHVEDGRPVEEVVLVDRDLASAHLDEPRRRDADRVRTMRRARRENAALLHVARRDDLLLPSARVAEDEDDPHPLEPGEVRDAVLHAAPQFDDGALAAPDRALA